MPEQHENINTDLDAGYIERMQTRYNDRSETTQEIINRKPDGFEKWTLPVYFLIMLVILGGTWFIKYPDTITGAALLTSENAPKEIVPHQGGKLVRLLVQNNQKVMSGEVIGWLESNAAHRDVIDLNEKIDLAEKQLGEKDYNSLSKFVAQSYTSLGEIQAPYQNFIIAWQQFNDYMVNGYYKKKRSLINEDISSLNTIKNFSDSQKAILKRDNELAAKSFEMNEILFKQKVISLEEYRQAQSKLLSNQRNLPQADVTVIAQQNQIRDKLKEMNQIDHDINQSQAIFIQALYTLKSAVSDWLKNYTIRAPADGQVIFILPLQQNQFIQQGKLLGYVNPVESKYYMEVKLSQNNFGKVDTGMSVQLRFDAYPYAETGFVPGKLSYISKIAVDSGFLGMITLEKGLVTNIHKTIPFKNGLKAQAIIITHNMRLFDRLYYTVVKSMTMNK